VSSLFGLISFGDAPILPGDLEAMGRALPGDPGDVRTERGGAAGFGQRGGSLLAQGDLRLVAAGRILNRREVARDLDLPAEAGEADLLLAAWRRWGRDCALRLEGDWAFAVWDGAIRRLDLLRDHHGNTALYWHGDGARLAFASGLGPLLALPWVPRRPDLLRVAQILAAWSGDGVRTAFEDLQALPPGQGLRAADGQVRTFRTWFPEALPPLEGLADDAYVEAFLEHYARAVERRLDGEGPVGILLSAGLDSGSVAALAGPLLQRAGRTFTAFTAVPATAPPRDLDGFLLDEGPPAEATARAAGAAHVRVDARGVGFLEALDRHVDLHHQPGHAAANAPWILAALEEARRRGLRVLLTGQQGNATVSHAGNSSLFWPALRSGRLGLAWRSLRGAERSLAAALEWQVLRPLADPPRRALRRLRRGGAPWSAYAALNPGLANEVRLAERMAEAGHDPSFERPAARVNLDLLDPGRNAVGAVWHELGEAFGIEVRDPTVDRALAEFCLRCPELQYRRGGEERWLLRRAFAGRLPGEVLEARRLGRQSADLGLRALAEKEAIAQRLDELSRHPLAAHCLDFGALRAVLEDLAQDNAWEAYGPVGVKLARGLAVGRFLSRI
jgi:asparagine synthase (glutamine-hydrolysing)